jgi:toxin FitB
MKRIILDTDVASLSLKGKLPPTLAAQLVGAQLGITFVTLGELTKWAVMRDWGPRNREKLARWLAGKPTLPYGDAVAHKWGEISAYAERRGRKRPHNDSWIAACCLVYGLPLATENVKDYVDFVEYEGLVLITR